jgi:hypothetical protein
VFLEVKRNSGLIIIPPSHDFSELVSIFPPQLFFRVFCSGFCPARGINSKQALRGCFDFATEAILVSGRGIF